MNPAEFVLDRRVYSFLSRGRKTQSEILGDERHLETTPLLHSTPQGWVCMIVGFTPKHGRPIPQLPPSSFQFSEAETSAVIFSTQSGAVTNDHWDKPKLFGSFFLFFYLWAPVGHKGIPAMTTMWVDPVCGMDSWHSRRLTSHRPEVGSDLEQIRGFSTLRLGLLDGSSCKTSKIAQWGMVSVVSRQLLCRIRCFQNEWRSTLKCFRARISVNCGWMFC